MANLSSVCDNFEISTQTLMTETFVGFLTLFQGETSEMLYR